MVKRKKRLRVSLRGRQRQEVGDVTDTADSSKSLCRTVIAV